jgi:hypothetical protein
MQVAEEVQNGKGDVISRRYICGNHETIYHHNVHHGNMTAEIPPEDKKGGGKPNEA